MNNNFDYSQFTNAGDAVLEYFTMTTYDMLFSKMGMLSTALHGTISVCLILVVMFQGALIMTGRGDSTYRDFLKMLLIASIVVSLTPSNYNYFVIGTAIDISRGLTVYISDIDSGTPFEAVHDVFFTVIGLSFDMISSGGITDLMPVVAGIMVLITFGAAYSLFAIALIFANFMLAINFLFGFILIKLSMFQVWRPVLKTWVQSLLKFALVPVVATLIATFGAVLVGDVMQNITAARLEDAVELKDDYQFWVIILTGIVTAYAMSKVIEITAELTGSVANDLGGATRGAAGASRAAVASTVSAGSGAFKLGKKVYGKGAW
jgi:hypothetical protein